MKHKVVLICAAAIGLAFFMAPMSTIQAQAPFLCPIVGDGVINADDKNGENGVSDIGPAAGTSLLPGKNKAGEKANHNAYNGNGGPDVDNNPGHNPEYTPIWNPSD